MNTLAYAIGFNATAWDAENIVLQWDCPNCKQTGFDSYRLTANPMCGGCEREYEWEQLLSADALAYANEQLRECVP